MTTSLGNTRYLADIRLSDNERIVWQGGAERTGVLMEILQSITALLLLAVLMGGVMNINKLVYKPNPAYVEAVQEKKTAEHAPAKIPAEIVNTPLLAVLGTAGVLLFFGGGLLAAHVKIRNYWFVITTERVCIQSGIFNIQVATIDLDKVVSIIVSHSLWDRLFNTHSIEVIHPGGKQVQPNGASLFNPYRIQYVSNRQQLPTELLSRWLPRDNRG